MKQEIQNILQEAKTCISKEKCYFGPDLANLAEEMTKLNLDNSAEIWSFLTELLNETKPEHFLLSASDPSKFAFSWTSKKLKKTIAIKFELNSDCIFLNSISVK